MNTLFAEISNITTESQRAFTPYVRSASMPINMHRLDLVSIRLAILCAELGSLSLAAKTAHLSLSSASHRLASLEASLGCDLFSRQYRGLHPTSAGRIFIEHGNEILQNLQDLTAKIARFGSEA